MPADAHNYQRLVPHPSEFDPTEVIPFGRYGAGLITAHPVGLVVVLGMLFMGLAALPPARLFFAASLPRWYLGIVPVASSPINDRPARLFE